MCDESTWWDIKNGAWWLGFVIMYDEGTHTPICYEDPTHGNEAINN